MLVTRVNRWSLTYCRCWGIEFQSQKSWKKSKELVVERSLKLDALNLNWLGVIDGPPLRGDATHGSLALKAYQQNLYLEYYYESSQATIA